MINQVDYTYSKYQQNAHPFVPRDDAKTTAVQPKGHTPVRESTRPEDMPGLHDMVDRLNTKVEVFGKNVAFEIDTHVRRPRILMVNQEDKQVLGSYETVDLMDLERSLHDMAGFRFSFEG